MVQSLRFLENSRGIKIENMKLLNELEQGYTKESLSAKQAQRLAHEIAFGPVVFQVSRIMMKFGIFQYLHDNGGGKSACEVASHFKITPYAAKILLESSLTIGTVLLDENRAYRLSKAGWFMLNDKMVRVNMEFNHDVNYQGLFKLEESLLSGKPEGLSHFGDWDTIYEGLSSLPKQVQDSWFGFDHFYSDCSFDDALPIVFDSSIKRLLDVGGNTGRWALKCVEHNSEVEVTIMDLPQQLELMRQNITTHKGAERIFGHGANLLDSKVPFPAGFDVIWMSQFLDCFSEIEVVSILSRAAASMNSESRVYIMETFWNRQQYQTAAYDLAQTSVYFTALANGNSKMYSDGDMESCVNSAGLEVEAIYDNLGMGHSIMKCKLR